MAPSDSVTRWINDLKNGDQEAARPLYERYFHRLLGLARSKLHGVPAARVSAEDVAAHAFASFCVRLEQKGFDQLNSRADLWALLARMVVNKALKAIRFHTAQGLKAIRFHTAQGRDFRREQGLSAPTGGAGESSGSELGVDLADGEALPPDVQAAMAEEFQRGLDCLGDEGLRKIALEWLQGYGYAEIAGRLDLAPETVERKLRRIRAIWREEGAKQ
jgi:DNA-directed RNA polymerase specialized sigma24 family protein